MKDAWDKRYQAQEYVYGTEPNRFFQRALAEISQPGRLLLPAEGEGRNAAHAAFAGWTVDAYDSSGVGREKALRLAAAQGVNINYEVAAHMDMDAGIAAGAYDAVALIFAHIHAKDRARVHRRCIEALAPGGRLILEGYSKKQLQFGTGGPPVVELLYSVEELRSDFETLTIDLLERAEVELQEGKLHNGVGSVIRLLAHRAA